MRTTIEIRRLSLGSLIKIHFIACFALIFPAIVIAALMVVFAPSRVHLLPGQTMGEFVFLLCVLPILWPAMMAVLLGFPAWIAMGLKGKIWNTKIDVIQSEKNENH